MVLGCAVASGSRFIATHNARDFEGSQHLGVQAVTPGWYLQHLEAQP